MKKAYLFGLVAVGCVGLSACTQETSNGSSGNSTYSSKSEIVTEESASVTSISTVSSSSSKEDAKYWTESTALAFLKNTMNNPENTTYNLGNWSTYDDRRGWSVKENSKNKIVMHWQPANNEGRICQLSAESNVIELLVFSDTSYPDNPEASYLVDQSTNQVIEYESLTVPESTASIEEIPVEQQPEPVQPKTEEEIKAEIIRRYAARSGMPAEKLFVVVIGSDDNGYDLQLRESGTTAPSGSTALALLYYDKHTSILYEDVVGKMEVASF